MYTRTDCHLPLPNVPKSLSSVLSLRSSSGVVQLRELKGCIGLPVPVPARLAHLTCLRTGLFLSQDPFPALDILDAVPCLTLASATPFLTGFSFQTYVSLPGFQILATIVNYQPALF